MRYVWIALRVIGVALLLFLAFTGISGGIHQFSGVQTTAQRIQTWLQLAMGITSALALIATFYAEPWARAAYIAFVLSCTLAAGLAAYAWGDQGLWPSLGSGVAALLVAWLIVWLARGRPRSPTAGVTAP